MNDCHAVLLDTASIQNYIFQSNKLRENLGASFLVEEIYRTYLACALCAITKRTFAEELAHLDSWKAAAAETPDCSKVVDIGYIGGGNALLFFQTEKLAQNFVEEWTKILLVHAPGLTTAVATSLFSASQEFSESLKALFIQLERNKAEHSPITSLPRHGITAECMHSGSSTEIYTELSDEYVSAGVNARIKAASASKNDLEKKYKSLLSDRFWFTNELEDLGGKLHEDSHIAIVHIDGNNIGERFKAAKTLKDRRALSRIVHEATESAFGNLVNVAAEKHDAIMQALGFDSKSYPTGFMLDEAALQKIANDARLPKSYSEKLHKLKDRMYGSKKKFLEAAQKELAMNLPNEHGDALSTCAVKRNILPIRPIILGGDDVTFVCDGKLGIYFAQLFVEAFENADKNLTACAGVAIIKTKYPFYRGVELAKQLCSNAKTARKEKNSPASFLDFHVSLGGMAGTLQEIRKTHFQAPQGSLLYRPFKIVPTKLFDELSLDLFLEKTCRLQHTEAGAINLPNNKINELSEALTLSEDAAQKFVQELKYRGRKLPEIEGSHYAETLFQDRKTPYFDMIEILRFYPDFVLREAGGKR